MCLALIQIVWLLYVWVFTFFHAYPQFLFRSTPFVVFLRHMSPPSTAFRPWMFSIGTICIITP